MQTTKVMQKVSCFALFVTMLLACSSGLGAEIQSASAKSFIDYFLPMPVHGKLSTNVWGAAEVGPRDPENGLEDPTMKHWNYWDGSIIKGSNGKYYMFASRWPQANGHSDWGNSKAVYAVSDNLTGPYVDQGLCWPDNEGGKGHNVTALVLPDGRYAVVVSETRPGDVFVSRSLDGPWAHLGEIAVATNEFSGLARKDDGNMSNVSMMVRPDGNFEIICRTGAIMISTNGVLGPYVVQGLGIYPSPQEVGLPLRGLEDPVIWFSGGLYHVIFNAWVDRQAYHMTSADGIHDWKFCGLAYDPRKNFLRYTDGTVNHWNKLERPSVYIENGQVAAVTLAVIDVPKEENKGNDGHGSKVIVVPFDGAASLSGSSYYTAVNDGSTNVDSAPATPRTQFLADQPWPDNNGVHINAHGGGILFHEGVYYWFGESYANPAIQTPQATGVHCYSSTDLYNWKDHGVVLARSSDPASEIGEGSIIERPKVIYNATTKKFVMWFHLELNGQGYSAARSGVAVADQPAGSYTFLRSERPDAGTWPLNASADEKAGRGDASLMAQHFAGGQMARDMTLFVDDDGKAYHIFASEDNGTLHISELSDDYLSHSGKWVRALVGLGREAPAICKNKGRYWLVTSGQSSWDPNTAGVAVADSIWGPWKVLGNPCTDGTLPRNVVRPTVAQWKQLGQPSVGGAGKNNLGFEHTYGGQSTFILPVHGQPGAFIAMFDIWRPGNQTTSGYVWLPVVFGNNGNEFTIPWRDPWNLSYFNGSTK